MRILRLTLFLLITSISDPSIAARFEILGSVDNPFSAGTIQVSDDGNTVLSPVAGFGQNPGFVWCSCEGSGPSYVSDQNYRPLAISGDGRVLVGIDYSARIVKVAASFDGSVVVGRRGARGFRQVAGRSPNDFTYRASDGFEVVPDSLSSDGNTVVGGISGPNHSEPFRWTPEEGIVLLGMLPGVKIARGNATDVSADGRVVVGIVGARHEFGLHEAFVWTAGEGLRSLHPPGTLDSTTATAISADGKIIVGQSFKRGRSDEAVLWDEHFNLKSIAAILTQEFSVDLRGVELRSASGVSADGRIVVGWGVANRIPFAWRADLTPIPEASSFAMVTIAVTCCALLHRSRRTPRLA